MFTGIVEELGTIRSLRRASGGAQVTIEAASITPTLKRGDSIAVNGVCLTVVDLKDKSFSCDLSEETLRRSSLGKAGQGTVVNLERPLATGGRLGGHIVQGHVDCTGRLSSTNRTGEGVEMEFSVPSEFEKYLVEKGSIAVDGISLTVARLKSQAFVVAVIPHTLSVTNLGSLRPGDIVNLEADILAKYFERFFQLGIGAKRPGLTVESLKEQGY